VGAQSITIEDYPCTVEAGKDAKVKVAWDNLCADGYKIVVQLENWDTNPPVLIMEEITEFMSCGYSQVSLYVPSDIPGVEGCKFVAACLSRQEEWEEVEAFFSTPQDVSILSEYSFVILDYPKVVKRGEAAHVKVAWNNIPAAGRYKVILQLENWDVEPNILIVEEIKDYKRQDKKEFSIEIPRNIFAAENCRFVLALISNTQGWEDCEAVAATPKDVTVK